jgi:hypothetical protein
MGGHRSLEDKRFIRKLTNVYVHLVILDYPALFVPYK